jgi:hypothetical protein
VSGAMPDGCGTSIVTATDPVFGSTPVGATFRHTRPRKRVTRCKRCSSERIDHLRVPRAVLERFNVGLHAGELLLEVVGLLPQNGVDPQHLRGEDKVAHRGEEYEHDERHMKPMPDASAKIRGGDRRDEQQQDDNPDDQRTTRSREDAAGLWIATGVAIAATLADRTNWAGWE